MPKFQEIQEKNQTVTLKPRLSKSSFVDHDELLSFLLINKTTLSGVIVDYLKELFTCRSLVATFTNGKFKSSDISDFVKMIFTKFVDNAVDFSKVLGDSVDDEIEYRQKRFQDLVVKYPHLESLVKSKLKEFDELYISSEGIELEFSKYLFTNCVMYFPYKLKTHSVETKIAYRRMREAVIIGWYRSIRHKGTLMKIDPEIYFPSDIFGLAKLFIKKKHKIGDFPMELVKNNGEARIVQSIFENTISPVYITSKLLTIMSNDA